MRWFRGGIIGTIVGLLIESLIFFIGHLCQIFLGGDSRVCPNIIIFPFSLIANLFNFSIRMNYLISLGIVAIIFFILGAIFLRKH